VTSQEIVEELQQLEQKLATLRDRAVEEQSTVSELERQVVELSKKHSVTCRMIESFEELHAETLIELAKAEYDDALQAREDAAARLAEAISKVLAELEAYNRAQQAVAACQGGADAGDAQAEPEVATESWERLVEAVQQRFNEQYKDELVEATSRGA